jgi:methylthioribose-1-phosphate isomerase
MVYGKASRYSHTMSVPKTIEWVGDLDDGFVRLIDQTRLPAELRFLECRDSAAVRQAICSLGVRGAPAIGVAGAMALVLGIRGGPQDPEAWFTRLEEQAAWLISSRPTAVNLAWAVGRLTALARSLRGRQPVAQIAAALLQEARAIRDEDAASCRAIGRCGAGLIPDRGGVLTHCNAGSLACSEGGTALAAMYAAHEEGRRFTVYSCETRPLLQGSRLTAWELGQAGIDVVVIADSMAAQVMREGRVQCAIVGADRIAACGDAANKIGTYSLAVLSRAHNVPFYIAAPASTFDLGCPEGRGIPIEERDGQELRQVAGQPTAPPGVRVYNPAFDVTPAAYIRALVTDCGLIEPVTAARIAAVIAGRERRP